MIMSVRNGLRLEDEALDLLRPTPPDSTKEGRSWWIETPENAWLRGQSYAIHRMVQLYGHATDKTYEFAPYEAPTPPGSRKER